MTVLDPVMLAESLWTLSKDGHSAEARVCSIPGVRLELRFSTDGELQYSYRYTAWADLEAAARKKARRF